MKNNKNNNLETLKKQLEAIISGLRNDVEILQNNFDILDTEIIQQVIYYDGEINAYTNLYMFNYCEEALNEQILTYMVNELKNIKLELKRLMEHITED